MSVALSLEPEHVPRKKNKSGSRVPIRGNEHARSSKKDTALLLPVSITSSQARPSRERPALRRKVSYGEISAEVDKIVAQSDVDDAELSAASLRRRGRVLFVDDEASEASQHSDDLSTDDEAAGTDCESDVRLSSSVEVVRVTTPLLSDNKSASGESVAQAESPEALEEVEPSRPLRSKTKTVKGAYIDKLLTTGHSKDVAGDDDLKRDPTVPFQGNHLKESDSDVYLEDLCQTPRIPSRAKGKTPLKTAASWCSSHSAKKEALSSNARLEEELSIDPVTDALTKTMSMSKAKKPSSVPKAVLSEDKYERKAPIANRSGRATATASSAPSPLKHTLSKPTGEINAPVDVSAMSVKRASSRKGATKALASAVEKISEPLFLPSDSDDTGSAPPPDLHAQLGADLAALLGDDIRVSSPEDNVDTPVLRLPDEFATQHDANTTDPKDPALHTMQPALMEDHLIALGVYESLPPLGAYHPVIPIGFTPESFDPPRFHAFTNVAKLFRLESLTSLVEAFKFGSYGTFVNLAHVPHSVLSFEKRSLHFAGSNAVCMMVGLVTECMLFEPATPGLFGAAKGVRRLRIMPFHQMFRHKSTVWALSIGDPCVESTCISSRGLLFPTRVEDTTGRSNNNSSYTSAQSTPAKGRRGSPMKKPLGTPALGPGGGYPNSLGFMDEVPIYDGRASAGNHFPFRPSDFTILKSLPRFTTSCDLDVFTMVSVGYSLTAWESYNKEPRLTPNILFVIVLGSAPKKDKLEVLGFLE
ncbi:hypothetical protein IW261DRAFT_1564433 [Armillaria novae-zelandiae]|uniref:Uncharacterized protein n=1 Tax=Armillaria novae-zelandiae TaxID=153914 RepID=A0AA39UF08_9AGAR|nr:hypothetical protein IW261DRAFT_1564433 [Armillaria novae-zelandiae]